ncbi:site-specific integrase [Pilimelia columellifera]|uniref:Tyr recombinase domain-containing protein n=1 Tax=Pilimelia columellifera subsp. columellifera TaxID=706583 RepID=A0ABP6AT58_9ACTN
MNNTSAAEVDAARLLLDRLGVTVEDLTAAPAGVDVPTFDAYIARVSTAVTVGTVRVYGPYWNRVRDAWGQRRLDEATALEVKQLAEHTRNTVVVRRNARGGHHAAEHMIAALRCLYRHAVADGLISVRANPAIRVPKPRRRTNARRALLDSQLADINTIVCTTGNDPDLDSLLLRLHLETACRRGGALALRPCDLDHQQCLVRLREKGATDRWQPVSPTLLRALRHHSNQRGDTDQTGALLRYRNGRPLTARRYDHLWNRVGQHLPWVAAQQISTHWLRHTTLTWVERHFGYGVARAYAGHDDHTTHGSTTTYIRADLYEITTALAALTGEHHPLLAPAATTR